MLQGDTARPILERHRLIHPIIRLEHLPAVESRQHFGAPLAKLDQGARADGAPEFAGVPRVAIKQVVLGAAEHLGGAGVALAGGAAEELAVYAAGAVGFGGQYAEAAELGDAGGEFDVGAAAGHVGGDGDLAALAGFGDDLGFFLVLGGVEDAVRDVHRLEALGDFFG